MTCSLLRIEFIEFPASLGSFKMDKDVDLLKAYIDSFMVVNERSE